MRMSVASRAEMVFNFRMEDHLEVNPKTMVAVASKR